MYDFRLRNNPFSSPPSSTGSHDTVSTTTEELTQNLSDFSFNPDGEGTRRFSEDLRQPPKRSTPRSGRFGNRPTSVINTSAIARAFPEWSGLVPKDGATTTTQDINFTAPAKTQPETTKGKENVPPAIAIDQVQDDTFENAVDSKRKRARADMQPRVDNESDCSTVLSRTPSRPVMGPRRSRFSNAQEEDSVSLTEAPKRSLQDMVSKIRTEKQTTRNQPSPHDTTPKQSPRQQVVQPSYQSLRLSNLAIDRSGVTPTGRSFFLPAFRHLPDWTSGTLKFSAMKNGVPVFVRSGKAGVRLASGDHGSINAVDIPEEDEEIFVSMDKLLEEVRELHDHDAMLQREAEKLQREVNQYQSELKRFSIRKRSDSAIGSDSDGSFNRRNGVHSQELEDQVVELQNRLDQASRQVGVHDIHSSALAAERDEALHQASVARERAQKLQAELEATHRDLESTLQYRREKETLEVENTSLVATNQTLKQQHESALHNNKKLAAQCDKLRQELAAVQKELAAARGELSSVRKQYEALQEEKKLISQDHASMERSNDTYFKENKKLQAQIAARDSHISDLKKGISTRDQMIDNIQGLTTDTAVIELNAELEAEVEYLREQLQRQGSGSQDKDGSVGAEDGRIDVLKKQNVELECEKEQLVEENKRLRAEYEEMRGQWIDDRHKVIRLNQLLTRNNTDYLKTLNDNTEDCVRLEEDFKQKEETLRHKLERREAAIKKVKQLTSKIVEISEQDITGKSVKVTRIVEPNDATAGRNTTTDLTGKSNTMNIDDDPTQELHLTQGSDFLSIMDNEIIKLKQTYRDIENMQEDDDITSGPVTKTIGMTQVKAQPVGILKKSSQFALDEDTGRFSVKSALSIASHHSEESNHTAATVRSHRSARSTSMTQNKAPRPESRLRRNSETTRLQAEPTTTEHNMTSAFFVPDITLQSEKENTAAQTQTVPSLSKDARRVLDGICKHKSDNCNVCVRIAAHGEKNSTNPSASNSKGLITADDMRKGKKTVRVEKPVPVSDRMAVAESKYDEEPTLRPSMPPGDALAILIKETQDEIEHLQMELKRLNEKYFGLDKSLGQRERRRIMAEIKRYQAEVEMKSSQLYRLHDVLEGQKQAGQLMNGEEIDVTILSSLLRIEGVTAESRDGGSSWNGFE
ncbi:hypothetical protein B0T19DRAFT_364759 [Cercophora scortea]|uniref:Uncharacterized protein n=1 Tax=Cercophora scortea TaxID=314031 RepID=A0AAE0J435_9PEZI|nr:hypothetical protein B0T19DRAFT_364759 [Cercophora scortea]